MRARRAERAPPRRAPPPGRRLCIDSEARAAQAEEGFKPRTVLHPAPPARPFNGTLSAAGAGGQQPQQP